MAEQIVHKLVAEVMTPYLITCPRYTSLAEVLEMMEKNHIRRVPVVEDSGQLAGLVTRSDILAAQPSGAGRRPDGNELRQALAAVPAEAVMTVRVHTIFQTDTLGHAAEIMMNEKIGGIPVLQADGKLAGLITESDIFRTIVNRWRTDNLLFSGAR